MRGVWDVLNILQGLIASTEIDVDLTEQEPDRLLLSSQLNGFLEKKEGLLVLVLVELVAESLELVIVRRA